MLVKFDSKVKNEWSDLKFSSKILRHTLRCKISSYSRLLKRVSSPPCISFELWITISKGVDNVVSFHVI